MSVEKPATQRVIEKRYRAISARLAWMRVISKIVCVIALCAVVFTCIFGVVAVDDVAMDPAVKDSDIALFYRLQDTIAAGDVVVYRANDDVYIGRVVACSSDTVSITPSGELEINGHVQINDGGMKTMPAIDGAQYPLTVGLDEYFILGDNRSSSHDSREWGSISRSDVEGKVFTILRRRNI